MPFEIDSPADLIKVKAEAQKHVNGAAATASRLLRVEDVMAIEAKPAEMLIESILSTPGLTMCNAPGKTGKTILAAQVGMSVAAGVPLLDYYHTRKSGPVLFLEKDDPSGAASIRDILHKTKIPIASKPFLTVPTEDAQRMVLDEDFFLWLDETMRREGIILACLDSYTALRQTRRGGGDFVKAETEELGLLDQLGKKHSTAILLNHHYSKGSASLDWSERAGGSFAVLATPEAQITITRFRDLPGSAPERLVQVRGRRFNDTEFVLRFNADTLGFEHVLEGTAAPHFPALKDIRLHFGDRSFTPKEFCTETGTARQTATRLIARLVGAGALAKMAYGSYRVAPGLGV